MTSLFQSDGAWRREGKRAAVCFSIDDVHPATRRDAYEAGGDLGEGALKHLEWLQQRHPKLQTTLFVTADWRCLSPVPTRRLLAAIPGLRDRFFLAPVRAQGEMRISGHPEFAAYLKSLPRTDVAFHGLEHVSRGIFIPGEFARLGRTECARRLRECRAIFAEAGLPESPGLCPPGWVATPALIEAMCDTGLSFLSSARDIRSPVTASAVSRMSGLEGRSLIQPEPIAEGRLLHFTVNFQATSPAQRARDIIEAGGLLNIKAHIVKEAFGYTAKDALDENYRDRLDTLLHELESEYGDALWWTSMGEIAREWPRAS